MGLIGSLLQKWFGIPGGNSSFSETPPVAEASAKHFHVVRVQPTPNPNAFQFLMSGPVIAGGTKTFNSTDEAKGDDLGEALFAVYGVENVFFKENFVTITKSEVVGWHTIMEKLGDTLEEKLTPYEAVEASEPHAQSSILEKFKKEDYSNSSDEEKAQIVDELLNVAIRPALANDGGGLDVLGIEGDVIKVHYQGACGSCPSSTTGTLTYIETFLKEALHADIKVQAS